MIIYDQLLLIERDKYRYYICISCNKEKSKNIYLDIISDFCGSGYITKICNGFDESNDGKDNVFYDIVILDPNDEDTTRIDIVLEQLTDFGSYHDRFYVLVNDRKRTVYLLFRKIMDRLKYVDNGGCSSTNITEVYYLEDRHKLSEEIIKLVNNNEKELNK